MIDFDCRPVFAQDELHDGQPETARCRLPEGTPDRISQLAAGQTHAFVADLQLIAAGRLSPADLHRFAGAGGL